MASIHYSPASLPANRFNFFGDKAGRLLRLDLGFRLGERGTHTSRTMMLPELRVVLAAVSPASPRQNYVDAVVEGNCLRKPTTSTRRLTLQRLSELYGLDPDVPIFRVLRRLWISDPASQGLLALSASMARDPLLMATAQSVLSLADGSQLQRDTMKSHLRLAVGERLNDSTLNKVARNAASSWTQSGHLNGRTFKIRHRVRATPQTIAFALYLGVGLGFKGSELLTSGWVKTLDCAPSHALDLAIEAKRIGLLDLRVAGDVLDLNLERLDPKSFAGGAR
jgi:hypothetical protein